MQWEDCWDKIIKNDVLDKRDEREELFRQGFSVNQGVLEKYVGEGGDYNMKCSETLS